MKTYYGDRFSEITIQDFQEWQGMNALDNIPPRYSAYSDDLSKQADVFLSQEKVSLEKLCRFLFHITSMCLTEKKDKPLDAMFHSPEGRSFALEDLSPKNLDYIKSIIPLCINNLLKARFADIIWIVRREIDMAWIALENYTQINPVFDAWIHVNMMIWKRASVLSRSLRNAENAILYRKKIQEIFYNKIISSVFSEKSLIKEYFDILMLFPLDEDKRKPLIEKIEGFLKQCTIKNTLLKRIYLDILLKLSHKNDINTRNQIYIRIAESFCFDAEQPENKGIISGMYYESAIKNYRSIPIQYRSRNNIEQKIYELQEKMRLSNAESLLHMCKVSTPTIDATQDVLCAESHVRGKDFANALLCLSTVSAGISYSAEKESLFQCINKYPFQFLLNKSCLNSEGKVIAHIPAINISNLESEESESAIFSLMVQYYGLSVNYASNIKILPGLRVFNQEHFIMEQDLIQICSQSTCIPPHREILWAKGLLCGFYEDFVIAAHLLSPQIEHMVRFFLQGKGEKTTIMDDDGIEIECGLSTLLKNKNILEIMSKDVWFELRALMTEHNGSNLRNQIAHGLLDDQYIYSAYNVYLWWFCLGMVVCSNPEFIKILEGMQNAKE